VTRPSAAFRTGLQTRALFVRVVSAALVLLLTPCSWAHQVGLSQGEYRLEGATLIADLGFSQRDIITALPGIDADGDGSLDVDEFGVARERVRKAIVDELVVTADGAACPGTLDNAHVLEAENGVAIMAHYRCPLPPRRLVVSWRFLNAFPPGHRHVARALVEHAPRTALGVRGQIDWTLDVANPAPASGIARSMFGLGVEHILTGADHLAFLLGVVLIGGAVRALLWVVTAFTLAHSITLALATLSIVTPSAAFVEPLIALSIAYVGVENFFVSNVDKRWRITFPFGLIHGFGFAGALREIALPAAQVPVALVSFNLGVEAGQLGVLALVLPALALARRSPQFDGRATKFVSFAIAASGFVLFVFRIVKSS
jgi:hydrogenase/urease accessory protein HupE